MRQLQILAGAVREIEMDLRIPLYLSDTSPLTLWGTAAAGSLLLPRVWNNIGIRNPVQPLIATSIFRMGALCSGWYRSRFSRDAGLVSFVFHLC